MKLHPLVYLVTAIGVAFVLAACSAPAPTKAPQPAHASAESASTAAAVAQFSREIEDGTLNHRGWALKAAAPMSSTATVKNLDATPKIVTTETVTCSKFDLYFELPVVKTADGIATTGSETRSYFVMTTKRSGGAPSFRFFEANSDFCS